jgi:hypothetical protein
MQFFFLFSKTHIVLNTSYEIWPVSFFSFFTKHFSWLVCSFAKCECELWLSQEQRWRLWEKQTYKNILLTTKLIFNSLPTLRVTWIAAQKSKLTIWTTMRVPGWIFHLYEYSYVIHHLRLLSVGMWAGVKYDGWGLFSFKKNWHFLKILFLFS